jgi:CubicO group peptidase (beta-lactamase class C family)
MSKSMTSMMIGLALSEGFIDSLDDPVTDYLPELEGGAYRHASVREVMEMRSGVDYEERYDFDNPSSHRSRVFAPAGAAAMIGTRSAMAVLTVAPMVPEELSTFSIAGETRSRNPIAPSAASIGFFFATFLISETACLMRVIAG